MPRPAERIDDMLAELVRYWKQNPDLRLGQIAANAASTLGYPDPFYVEDTEMMAALELDLDPRLRELPSGALRGASCDDPWETRPNPRATLGDL